jgi:hypothetical protein
MVKHVDVCQWSAVLMDSRLSSLDQVGSRNERVFELRRQLTRSSAFPLLLTVVV